MRCRMFFVDPINKQEKEMSDNKPQPPPKPTTTTPVWKEVVKDMEGRNAMGIEKYGTPLQYDNERDHLVDLYQELLDAVVYLKAERMKRANLSARVQTAVQEVRDLRLAMYDLFTSYEYYCATTKPESEWDEYDFGMNPHWLKAKKMFEQPSILELYPL